MIALIAEEPDVLNCGLDHIEIKALVLVVALGDGAEEEDVGRGHGRIADLDLVGGVGGQADETGRSNPCQQHHQFA
jgi:hypothetical protein